MSTTQKHFLGNANEITQQFKLNASMDTLILFQDAAMVLHHLGPTEPGVAHTALGGRKPHQPAKFHLARHWVGSAFK